MELNEENLALLEALTRMMKPYQLWMMVGLPGSGKSSNVEHYFKIGGDEVVGDVIVSTDNIIEKMASAEGKTYDDVFEYTIKSAQKQMNEELTEAVKNHTKVIFWDQTNLSKKTRAKKIEQFKKIPGSELYTIGVCFLDTPYEMCLERIKNRPGKNISITIMESMKSQLEIPEYSEGIDELWHITPEKHIKF